MPGHLDDINHLANSQNSSSNSLLDKVDFIQPYQTKFRPMPITWPFSDVDGYGDWIWSDDDGDDNGAFSGEGEG